MLRMVILLTAVVSPPVWGSPVDPSLASPYAASSGSDYSVVVTSIAGLMVLDSSGALKAWRPEPFLDWQKNHVATNPRNGTICWVVADEDHSVDTVLRCATVDNLNQTWELTPPRGLPMRKVYDIAYDWTGGNWYLSTYLRSYVCDYELTKCLKLTSGRADSRFSVAYDLTRRMMFRIVNEGHLKYKLESLRLDGSDLRTLPTELKRPKALALDPVNSRVFFIEYTNRSETIYSINYDGGDRKIVMEFSYIADFKWDQAVQMDAFDGRVVFKWGEGDQKTVSMIETESGKRTDLVSGTIPGETIPALAEVTGLLDVTIYTPASQPDVENRCQNAAANCSDFCVPIVAEGVAAASCYCEEGHEIVEFSCRKITPAYAVIAGGNSLQAVNLQTEEIVTILSGLTNVTSLDVFVESEDDFLLVWIDDGSLFTGHYHPRECHLPSTSSSCTGTVHDIKQIVKATASAKVKEVAVDWDHRHIIWLERDPTKTKDDESAVSAKMTPLDGSYKRTIMTKSWQDPHALFVEQTGHYFSFLELDKDGNPKISCYEMTGPAYSPFLGIFDSKQIGFLPKTLAIDISLRKNPLRNRFFWVDPGTKSVLYITADVFEKLNRTHLLTHPSLAHAGGIDVLQSRVYWTDSNTGTLFSADSVTGEDVRELLTNTGGGALRILHPWRQPRGGSGSGRCEPERNGCSHFCVTDPTSFRPECMCPDGMQILTFGGKMCEKVAE